MSEQCGGPPVEAPTSTGDTTTAAGTPLIATPGMDSIGGKKRYQVHFIATYAALGAVLVAAMAVFVIVVVQPGHKPAKPWSAWQPLAGSTAKMSSEIADHVSHLYKLNASGAQLVAVVPSKPTVTSGTTNISIKAIAIRKASAPSGIEVLNSNKSEMYTFCGLGQHCSIASGTPSSLRGRLVRREALEVALYTFKFVPSIDSSVIVHAPRPRTRARASSSSCARRTTRTSSATRSGRR